jgi:hypothetical protein
VRPLAQGQRWTAPRKREVVLRLLRGEPLELLSRELGVELYRLGKWRGAALASMEEALESRNGAPLKAELNHVFVISFNHKELRNAAPAQPIPK